MVEQFSKRFPRRMTAICIAVAFIMSIQPVFDRAEVSRSLQPIDIADIIQKMIFLEDAVSHPETFALAFQNAFQLIRQSAGIECVIQPLKSFGCIYRIADAMERSPENDLSFYSLESMLSQEVCQHIDGISISPLVPPPESFVLPVLSSMI